jgi:GTP cyclohydrolase IA
MSHRMKEGITNLVEGIKNKISVDLEDENFLDTPDRVLRTYNEMVKSNEEIDVELDQIFSKTFPTSYSGHVIWPDIITFSLCPHHLVPVEYSVTIGYMPRVDTNNVAYVVGLSKPVRLARLIACQPLLQETYTQKMADIMVTRLDPEAVAVITRGLHGCMKCRGVKTDKPVIMSVLYGGYMEDGIIRNEFFDLLKLYR